MSQPEPVGAEEWRGAGEIDYIYITGEPPDRVPSFCVDLNGITRIEKWAKSGMHANIAYVRVWKGDHLVAEFCQHALAGVYFKAPT